MCDPASISHGHAVLFYNGEAQNIVNKSLLAHDRASRKKAVHSALLDFNQIVGELDVPFFMGMKIRNRVFRFVLAIMKDKSNADKYGDDKIIECETDILEVWFTSDW